MIAIACPVYFQRHTYEDSTFKAESSTGNTRLAGRFLTKLSVFCWNFVDLLHKYKRSPPYRSKLYPPTLRLQYLGKGKDSRKRSSDATPSPVDKGNKTAKSSSRTGEGFGVKLIILNPILQKRFGLEENGEP